MLGANMEQPCGSVPTRRLAVVAHLSHSRSWSHLSCSGFFLLLAVIFGTAACSGPDKVVSERGSLSEVSTYLTSEARADLKVSAFGTSSTGVESTSEISPARARELAGWWVHTSSEAQRRFQEELRGGAIEWSSLSTCLSERYVSSPFAAPSSSVPPFVRRAVGPWWVVTFCASAPQMTVAVSAWANDIRGSGNNLEFPRVAGNYFRPRSVPLSPEANRLFMIPMDFAILEIGRRLGARIASAELVAAADVFPQYARWRVVLDHAVSVRRPDDSIAQTNVLYFGYDPDQDGASAIMIAAKEQRPPPIHYYQAQNHLGSPRASTVGRRLRPAYAAQVERVQGP